MDSFHFSRQSAADFNPDFRGWRRAPLPRDPAALDRLADLALSTCRYGAADHLAQLAAELRVSNLLPACDAGGRK